MVQCQLRPLREMTDIVSLGSGWHSSVTRLNLNLYQCKATSFSARRDHLTTYLANLCETPWSLRAKDFEMIAG